MTAPEPDVDPVRAFTSALTAPARHHLRVDYDAIRYIRAATEKHTPAELARIVGAGIGYRQPVNPHALMVFRLRREAGRDDDNTEAGA